MKEPVFTGSAVALVTPFRNYKIDFEKLGQLIEYHIASSTDAIVVCATTGESPTQSSEEHLEAIGYSVNKAAGRIKVIAGTGSNDTEHAVMMCRTAQDYGADAFLMVTPYYNKTTQRGLVKHFQYVADRVDKPIIVYNVPSRTGLSFTIDTYEELSKHPMINGTKEASSDMGLVAGTLARCSDEFHVWSGNDEEIVPIMSLGGKGVISVVANIMPVQTARLCKLALRNNFPEAAKIQLEMFKLIKALFLEVNPIPVKTAMNLMGFDVGELRLPLYQMSENNLEILKRVLIEYGLLN